jgi:hypothetical protein
LPLILNTGNSLSSGWLMPGLAKTPLTVDATVPEHSRTEGLIASDPC